MEVSGNLTTECVKEISDFGSTTYQNICTGETTIIPWGNVMWFLTIFMGIMLIIIITMIIIMIIDR